MKALRYFFLILVCAGVFSCQKAATTPSSSMSASINGASTITFSSSFTNSNGISVLQGTSNTATIQIYIQNPGPGTYYFQSPGSYPYATVTTSTISGSYSTYASNLNVLSMSTGSTSGLYNGSFSFSATGSAGTINVTGQFSNM